MQTGEFALKAAAVSGARKGAAAWLICAVLDMWLLGIIPWFVVAREYYRPFDTSFFAIFFLLCCAAGAAVGALTGIGLHLTIRRFRQAKPEYRDVVLWAIISLTLLVVLESNNFGVGPSHSTARLALSKALLVVWIAIAIVALRSTRWRFAVHPAVALGFYPGSLCIFDLMTSEGYRPAARGLALLLVCGGTLAAGFLVSTTTLQRNAGIAFLGVLALTGLLSAAMLRPEPVTNPPLSSAQPGARPNVILIVLDTVRADHLSVYGYGRPTTPNLARFASQATLFQRAVAAGEWTLPSHASIFTGLYAIRHGAHYQPNFRSSALSRDSETIAEMLSRRGFATAAVTSNCGVVSKQFHFDQGFEHFDQSFNRHAVGWYSTSPNSLRGTLSRIRGLLPSRLMADSRPASVINSAASGVLDLLQEKKRPFLLFLNYMDTHDPYVSSSGFENLYGRKGSLYSANEYQHLRTSSASGQQRIAPEEVEGLTARYDAALTSLDAELGNLFDGLRRRGRFDNSLIIVTADHGEALGERGHLGHGGLSVYDNQVHVPLIIKFPNARDGVVIQDPVSHVDIVPTILETLGYGLPGSLDGVSLASAAPGAPRAVFSEMYPEVWSTHPGAKRYRFIHQSVQTGARKLISSADGRRELFDPASDPREERNLAGTEPVAVAELESRLREWRQKSVSKPLSAPAQLSTTDLEKLKSLGYVQGK